jgi:hypothetical protein
MRKVGDSKARCCRWEGIRHSFGEYITAKGRGSRAPLFVIICHPLPRPKQLQPRFTPPICVVAFVSGESVMIPAGFEDVTDATDFRSEEMQALERALRCGVCKDFFDYPILVPQCGHSFCSMVSLINPPMSSSMPQYGMLWR